VIEPYAFVRFVTISLGTVWTVAGIARALRTAREWRVKLEPLALDDAWWRKELTIACLRATVLDPVNLALLCLLLGLWSHGLRG